ncbi:MAG: Oligopeptide transport ATP-binding protein OppD [Chlamydiae bacterium]|nr:Oligopeptide transport ATP-binding protein OppD [Chlamydiota bacterium]
MPNKSLLQVRNLQVSFKTYLGRVKAVRDVSFEVDRGETVAIVGESGCGKTVTAQAIMRLIPSPPGFIHGGEILFEDNDLLKKSRSEMKRIRGKEMGMIFQDPMTSLNPTMRIGKQIAEGLRKHRRLSKFEAKERAIEMLDLVRIADPAKRYEQYPHEFSGGMRQRAMIAIALACDPKLLIADEPTTALDVTIQAQILELMKSIQAKTQTSIILITHDLGIVASTCDRVIVMYGGKIVETGTVDQIFSSPIHPYTQGLLRSVPRLDMDRSKRLVPIYGTPPNLLNPPEGCAFCARCDRAMVICKSNHPPLLPSQDKHKIACWLNHKESHEQKTAAESTRTYQTV